MLFVSEMVHSSVAAAQTIQALLPANDGQGYRPFRSDYYLPAAALTVIGAVVFVICLIATMSLYRDRHQKIDDGPVSTEDPIYNHTVSTLDFKVTENLKACRQLGENVNICHVYHSAFELSVGGQICFTYRVRDFVLSLYDIFINCIYSFDPDPRKHTQCTTRIGIDSADENSLRYLLSSVKYMHIFVFDIEMLDLSLQSLITIVDMKCSLTYNQTADMLSYMANVIY